MVRFAAGQAVVPAEAEPRAGAIYRSRHRRPGRRGRRARGGLVLTATAIIFALLLSTVAWVGVRGSSVRTNLLASGDLMRRMQEQLVSHDMAGARATLSQLQERTRAARSATESVDWGLGTGLPFVGVDLDAVRTVAVVLDDLSQQALPVMVDLVGGFDFASFVPQDGRLDLTALQRAAPSVTAVDSATRLAVERIAAIPSGDLLEPLRRAVDELAAGLNQLVTLTSSAAKASVLLPSMLGANGPRTYLMLFQNLAEVRATGGMPGAFVVVRAEQGALTITDQGSAGAVLMTFDEPVLPLDPGMEALYTDRLGKFAGDINASPHFPTAAALAREMYRRRTGTTVDGVIAADPVALSYLLRATGPLPMVSGGSLTADNAVQSLLSDSYARLHTPAEQDQFFASAARIVFDALTGGAADPRTAVTALARAAGERRLLVWSADPVEQTKIAGTVLEGSLPIQDGTRPTVGVFLNDGSGAKLGYYLTHDARLEATGCRADGRLELALQATLGSTAPAAGLSADVLGLGLSGDPYTSRTNVTVFSPAGGAVLEVRLDGEAVDFGSGYERRRQVGVVAVDVKPGQTRTINVRLLSEPLSQRAADATRPDLWVTPGVNPWRLDVSSALNCPILR